MNSKLLSPVSVSGQASSLLQTLEKPLTSPRSFARIQGLLLPSGLLFKDPALIKCTPHKPIFFPFPSHHPCSQPIVIKEKGRECRRQEASLNAFANPFYSCRKHYSAASLWLHICIFCKPVFTALPCSALGVVVHLSLSVSFILGTPSQYHSLF